LALLGLPALSGDLLLKIAVITVIGIISVLLKTASLSGFAAGMILGGLVIIYGDWNAFFVIAFFHVVAAIFTRFKYEKKRRMGLAQEKGGARSWGNVVANGAWASAAAVLEGITGGRGFVGAYLASVSTGLADTLATEVGLLSESEPRLVTDLRRTVERGASGGVTLLGTSVALLASVTIGVLAVVLTNSIGLSGMLREIPASTMLLTSIAGGFIGNKGNELFFDFLLDFCYLITRLLDTVFYRMLAANFAYRFFNHRIGTRQNRFGFLYRFALQLFFFFEQGFIAFAIKFGQSL